MTSLTSVTPLGDSMTQQVALGVLESGRNAYLTGPPGAGKSWLIRKFVTQAVSGISGDFGSFFIIIAVLVLSITLDIVQEHRAEQEAEALRHSVAVNADVMRDLKQDSRPVSTLVPGDIVLLRAGDLVPADGIVLESDDLQVDESILSGEPFPGRKSNASCAAAEAGDASNALFAGTSVVAGKATMLLVETGPCTRFGAIASALAANVPPTALEQGVRHLGLLILRLTIFLTLFVLLAHLAHRSFAAVTARVGAGLPPSDVSTSSSNSTR